MGAPRYTVPLQKIVTEQGLTVLHAAADYDAREISTADVNRPGLQLAGFYNYFDPERLQIIGRVESTFLETLTSAQRRERFETFMRYNIIGLVICHGMDPFPECLEMAEKYDRNLFLVRKDTSEFMADLIASLSSYLAPRLTQHGVLVEVFGEGVLITGDSGVGKSETALELIKRGHRLVADDAVEIKRINRTTLMGSAPEMIRYYMELRGIGVIDARQIYGVGAVKPESRVDLVVQLEPWEDGKAYDRLGLTTEYCEILNVRVPCVTIPVGPGRNLAVILELAAMNNRQKGMGYNAAQKLAADLRQNEWMIDYDESGAIGRRYRRQDEIGTPLCITVDFDTLEDHAVTIRERDTMAQERVALDKVADYVAARIGEKRTRVPLKPVEMGGEPWPESGVQEAGGLY